MFQFIAPPMPHYTVSGEDTYPVGGEHPNRKNIGVFDLLVVTRGCLFLEENAIQHSVEAGHYLLLRPDRAHRTATPCTEETHFHWLHFQTLGQWSEVTDEPLHVPSFSGNPYAQIESFSFYLPRSRRLQHVESVLHLLRQLLAEQQQQTVSSYWKRQQIFSELLMQLHKEGGPSLSANSRSHDVAEKAAEFLRQNYQRPLSYKELAEALHFHGNYISLCMKKTFGCTPLEYVTNYRVEHAKRLLIHTNETIGHIAMESGFGSFPYFVRCFHRYTGMAPRAFRMLYRST